MDVGLRGKVLDQLLEFLAKMPDAKAEGEAPEHEMGEGQDMESSEDMGGDAQPKGKIEMMAIEAKPKMDAADMMKKMKGC